MKARLVSSVMTFSIYVAAGEIGIGKDFAEDAFGEQVLNEHALDGFFGKIGIDGLAAESIEIIEAADKGGILAAFVVDGFLDGGREFGDALGKIADGGFPFGDVGRLVVEELVDDVDQRIGTGDFFVEDAGSALIEDGAFRGLENDVVARVAFVEFEFDFFGEVVFFVFGFPVAVREVVEVDEGAVDDDGGTGAFDAVFGDESEMELASAFGE